MASFIWILQCSCVVPRSVLFVSLCTYALLIGTDAIASNPIRKIKIHTFSKISGQFSAEKKERNNHSFVNLPCMILYRYSRVSVSFFSSCGIMLAQCQASIPYITKRAFEITANFNQSDETDSWKMERAGASIFAGGAFVIDGTIQNAGT